MKAIQTAGCCGKVTARWNGLTPVGRRQAMQQDRMPRLFMSDSRGSNADNMRSRADNRAAPALAAGRLRADGRLSARLD